MQIVDHDVPTLGADAGDQCIELDDLPLYLLDAEPLADLAEDPYVDAVVVLRLLVLVGVRRIVGDAERDPVGEDALVGSVAPVEAHPGHGGIGGANASVADSQRKGECQHTHKTFTERSHRYLLLSFSC